jgi:hypothetical protein
LVRLTQQQEDEATRLLAELLLDAAARERRASPGGFGSVIDGASGSVVQFPERRGDARDAA